MDVKINADVEKSLELICNKIGIAANEVIPHYVKIHKCRAIGELIYGIMLVILPIVILFGCVHIPIKEDYDNYDMISSPEGWKALYYIIKIIVCFITASIGIYNIADSIEEYFAAKGIAISALISQIRD